VFTLRLLDRIRPLPRQLLPTTYAVEAILFAPLLVLPTNAPGFLPLAVLAFAAFIVLETVAAGYLSAEARRRSGSARVRLLVAGTATALLALAILVLLLALAGEPMRPIAGTLARAIALVAAVGYAVAFLPPAALRRSWQAAASYRLSRRLLESADATDPAHPWHRLADLAVELTGAEAAVIRGADAHVRAAVGLAQPPAVAPEAVQRLLDLPSPPLDRPVAEAGEPWVSIARLVQARFMTVVPVRSPGTSGPAVVMIYSRHRSLFGEDDRELLAALGAQAAILAERAALAADLNATVEELRSANAAKSDFLASMSHELRTPLNAIIGFSELMRLEGRDRERVLVPSEWVGHVASAGQHLLDLINDVLDLAKVEAGRLDLDRQPFDLDAAALEWIGGVRPLADRKGVSLFADGNGGMIEADRGRLRQIAYNLLSNAIKFTPTGGQVRLELSRSDDGVRLTVADSGLGIAPEDHEAVFEEFRQVGRPGDRQPGTGLGLALTRRLVEAHGGRIELESSVGAGSRFSVHLPQRPQATIAPRAPDAEVVGIGGGDAEVLVIEDDPGAVRLVRESLEGAGWRVRAAADGPTGLAAARERRPHAIVLDVLLPGIDGWDVLRALKADPELRDVPVLMLTVVDEREVGLALGATDYLVKPVERGALLARLARYTFTTKVREGEVRVLVVDDDPATVAVMADGLEQEGFLVARAHGGREAIALAQETPPHLVVCDLVMPDVDGFALIRALKEDSRTRDAPILVVTGHDISQADKARLNGDILGIVAKGADLGDGLRRWLGPIARQAEGRVAG
jgi:signal transduction histidine kinase/CheY-like chemotaxis protein